MKREDLNDLGLQPEGIDKIMKLYGQGIQAERDKFGDVESIKTERDNLKDQMATRDKDFKALQKKVKDDEGLSTELEELKTKYDKDTKAKDDALAALKFNTSLDSALKDAKVRDVNDIKPSLDLEKIQLGDDGKLNGLDEQLKTIRENKGYLFDAGTDPHYKPNGGKGEEPSAKQAFIDAIQGNTQ